MRLFQRRIGVNVHQEVLEMFSRKNRNWEKKIKTEKLDKENSAEGLIDMDQAAECLSTKKST